MAQLQGLECNAKKYSMKQKQPLYDGYMKSEGVVFFGMKEGDFMTIEVALLVSGISLAFGIYQGIANLKRNKATDDKKDATEMTTVIVKLESIGTGVTEIKSDMKNIRQDLQDLRERVVVVEQSTKSAHHRINTLEGVKDRNETKAV
nr:MAG TPA: hemolysin [Caudoviricetes sp.]